jgi:hypothetical protein
VRGLYSRLEHEADKVAVKVVSFDKVESLHMPVEWSAGVGF